MARVRQAGSPLGVALLDWMAQHGYKAARLGAEAGLSDQTISRMLYTGYTPRVENLRKLNAVLGWDAALLERLAGQPTELPRPVLTGEELFLSLGTRMAEAGVSPGVRQNILGLLRHLLAEESRSAG